MKRKFAILIAMAAMAAMALPASSMALSVQPPGQAFEIKGTGMPLISSSLPGSCTLTKIAGTVPSSPANEATIVGVPITTPTVSCTSGVTMSFVGSGFQLRFSGQSRADVFFPGGSYVLRYSSLPGCKLESSGGIGGGLWMNGSAPPQFSRPGWHGDGSMVAYWKNDGATCAMSPQSDTVTFRSPLSAAINGSPMGAQVNVPITVYGGGF